MSNPYNRYFNNPIALPDLNEGNYFYAQQGQQDEFMDNRSTVGQVTNSGNRYVDLYNKQIEEQALSDNTLDFIPASRFGGIARSGKVAADGLLKAEQISKYVGIPIQEARRDVFRGQGAKLQNNLFGTNAKVHTSPTLKIVPNYASAELSKGANFVPRGQDNLISNIYVNGAMSKADIASTVRHEYDHDYWFRKYKGKQDPLEPAFDTPMEAIGNHRWASKPHEVNAQARQIQHTLAKLDKQKPGYYRTRDVERLEDLVKSTSPYRENFVKQYPDELGDYLFKGADFLDNMKHRK